MGFKCGIVGLPNVGKSTIFNALTSGSNAAAANFPFCTIEPNVGVVAVPDPRVEKLVELVQPGIVVHASMRFVDIAGLVRGASTGEGLGNKFLGQIREVDAIVHIVRCFEDDDVVHVEGRVDPKSDIEAVKTELALKDLETLEKSILREAKVARSGEKKAKEIIECAERLRAILDDGRPASLFQPKNDIESEWFRELYLLTAKPVLYVANVGEADLLEGNEYVDEVRAIAEAEDAELVVISGKIESEIAQMEADDRAVFLQDMGLEESGLDKLIRAGYRLLGLRNFFTVGPKEVHSWTIHQGWTAPKAAGVIHTDFERGFIRVEVIAYDDFVACGSEAASKEAGKMRVEGREYVVQNGNVMYFRFSV